MRRLLTLLALGSAVLLVLSVGAVAQSRVARGSIEDAVDRQLGVSDVPGLAYAVVADGRITAVGARGVVRSGGDREVTPDTAFVTGSIAKSFTALAVMQLVEAGEVDLDAEVSRYLDAFSGKPAGAITVRQLLSHTSGLSTLQGNASHRDLTEADDELARLVDRLATTAPSHAAGDRWEYSNSNYQILGRLVEVVSAQSYQHYVESNILEPIGMEHSFVADGESHSSMATGHRPWFGGRRPLPENTTDRGTAPQGGIIASAADLARYLQVMMNGEDDVLSAGGKALMMRPAGEASPSYGFGWFVDTVNGTVWHSGSTPGVETLATMIPAKKKGAVVLVNAGSGTGFNETTQLRNGVVAAALGLDYAGEGSRIVQRAVFVALLLLPMIYLLSVVWVWRHRDKVRAKSGAFGLFSLWFPLLTTLGAAWVVLDLVPRLLGSPLSTINLYQPDLGLAMTATAVTGVVWAVFRLVVAYTGRSAPS